MRKFESLSTVTTFWENHLKMVSGAIVVHPFLWALHVGSDELKSYTVTVGPVSVMVSW